MRIGVLTGGGDCPGLNAVIHAVTRTGESVHGHNLIGFRHGWRGVAEGESIELTHASTRGILNAGGTILGTSRYHPADHEGSIDAILDTLQRDRIEALIVVGGDGTLAASQAIADEGIHIIGIPKTIDNDVMGTERSIGFDTAVNIATDAIDRVHTTAESHDRVMVVEVMGHRAGWIAVCAGIAGGANVILIPEEPFDVNEITARIRHRHRRGATSSIVVVAEGAVPAEGTLDFKPVEGKMGSIMAGAIGERVRDELETRTGFETRVTVLGHVQRGGPPTPADRLLAVRFGVAAMEAINSGEPSSMTALVGDEVCLVPLPTANQGPRTVPDTYRSVANRLIG